MSQNGYWQFFVKLCILLTQQTNIEIWDLIINLNYFRAIFHFYNPWKKMAQNGLNEPSSYENTFP